MSKQVVCRSCNISKSLDEFNKNKNGEAYPDCRVCNTTKSAAFWAERAFKYCKACESYKPLRKFDFKDGVPHYACRKCFETKTMAKLSAERRQRDECTPANAVSGAATQSTPVQVMPQNVRGTQGAGGGSNNTAWTQYRK